MSASRLQLPFVSRRAVGTLLEVGTPLALAWRRDYVIVLQRSNADDHAPGADVPRGTPARQTILRIFDAARHRVGQISLGVARVRMQLREFAPADNVIALYPV